MAVLLEAGLPSAGLEEPLIEGVGPLGYHLQTAVMREQLTVGRSVVLECVVPVWVRDRWWQPAASDLGASFSTVECVCSDPQEHRRRVEDRRASGGHGSQTMPTWDQVETTMQWYERHPSTIFLADSMKPVDTNVGEILKALGGESTAPT